MVLRLKAWESRTLPGPRKAYIVCNPTILSRANNFVAGQQFCRGPTILSRANNFVAGQQFCRGPIILSRANNFVAGWSSPVARQAHNLKVVGSNPTPQPAFSLYIKWLPCYQPGLFMSRISLWKHIGVARHMVCSKIKSALVSLKAPFNVIR